MKSFNKIVCSIVLFFGYADNNVHAQVIAPYLQEVRYSTNIDYVNAEPISIFSNHVIIDTIGSASSTLTPAVITDARNTQVDGYHLDSSGFQYYSFNTDTRVGGVQVLKSDIIRCLDFVCSGFSIFFDSDALSVKDININAFTLDPNNGELIFSIQNDGEINGSTFLASDLIRFDGTNFSLEYNSLSDIFSRYKNIDGLMFASNNRYLVSFANESIFHEIYEYNLTTNVWSTAYTPLSFGDSYSQINIKSLMVAIQPVPDLIFQDSFE